jgi:hypothetical protein
VFINETLSTESLINQLLIRGLVYQLLLKVGKLGQVMRSCKCTSHVCHSSCSHRSCHFFCSFKLSCVIPVALFKSWLEVTCLAHITSIKVVSRSLPDPQVTLFEPHTAETSLRRHRSGSHSQLLPGHADQARELLNVLFPPHQRVCDKKTLLEETASFSGITEPVVVWRLCDTPVDLVAGGNTDGKRPCLGNGDRVTSDQRTLMSEGDVSTKRILLLVGGCTDTPVDLVYSSLFLGVPVPLATQCMWDV